MRQFYLPICITFAYVTLFLRPNLVSAQQPGRPKAPERVEVLPVFLIPKGEAAPAPDQIDRLLRHLKWAQSRYAEMLPKQATFKIADRPPLIYRASESVKFYRSLPAEGSPRMVMEVLRHLRMTRTNCPYVFLTVMMNPNDQWPNGSGMPFNGGSNNGGGCVFISSHELDNSPNFQSTLQHELGHSFGLLHVDAYEMDMQTSPSLMSYNPKHHTDGFNPSTTPGTFIPEDIRALTLNWRVFPQLKDVPPTYVPNGYVMKPLKTYGPMIIPKN